MNSRQNHIMKAIGYRRYGGTGELELMELPRPVPAHNDVLVHIQAAALNPVDLEIQKGRVRLLSGHRFPRIAGSDFAGVVAALGEGIKDLRIGDAVYGFSSPLKGGAYAEYLSISRHAISRVPPGLTMEESASLALAALTALQALRDLADLQPGQTVFIHGASGGVGTAAVQIAKAMGARVCASCSYRNLALVSQLGADEVLDYTQTDLTKINRQFDCYFDVFGNMPYPRVRHLLAPRGKHISSIPSPGNFFWQALTALFTRKKTWVVLVRSRTRDLDALSRLVEEGKLKAVIDRSFPLEKAGEAQAFLQTRRAKGKVVLSV